ncbi:MAG TPA: NusG domain II-containing protein [Candidatus Fimenecus stercoravium]|nr:NusG domain II-containing protein [Candidatus Fimenecus stercoravium]
MKERKWISKTDGIVLGILVLFAAGFLLWRAVAAQPGMNAVVTVDGEAVLQIDLQSAEDAQSYTLQNGVQLVAENHTVRFAESDCPDGICVETGALQKVGESAACVPNRTVVTVVGGEPRDVDVIAY